MPIKWDEKMVMEHAKELKSPFDETLKPKVPGIGGLLGAIKNKANFRGRVGVKKTVEIPK